MTRQQAVLHVVSHIRWHREGLEPFQAARLRLVGLFDDLIDSLSTDPEAGSLLLDGQAVLLDDYLEMRPAQAGALRDLIEGGRLQIGPWYIATDPFLVSPEALIRNLLLGAKTCEDFGGRLDIGYLPDTSGQIGQMPQILQGFGIDTAVVRDGLDRLTGNRWWEAPDGSRVLLLVPREDSLHDTDSPDEIDALKAHVLQARDDLKERNAAAAMLLVNGNARFGWPAGTAQAVREVSRRVRGIRVSYSSLQACAADALNREDDYPLVVGELRSPERSPLRSGVLSSRIWIKQRNHAVQALLERWTEPFSVWAARLHSSDPSGDQSPPLRAQSDLIRHAWRILLQNHSVDSIRGATVDQVSHEMTARFDQAAQIGETLTQQNLRYLAGQVATAALPAADRGLPVVVFNGLGHSRTDLVSLEIEPQPELAELEVLDETGTPLPCEVLIEPEQDAAYPEQSYRVRFVAPDVPGTGYRTFVLRPAREDEAVIYTEDSGTTIENEHLSVSLDINDGTLTLFDKRTGRSFAGLNRYIDGGDRGDVFTACPPERDTLIAFPTNTPLKPDRHIGPATQTLEYLQIYRLPLSLTLERTARLPLAAQFLPILIQTTLRISRGVPRVDIEVSISNGARDHRLRTHFPTGIQTHEAFFDGHLEIVRRPVALPAAEDTLGWAEQPVPEKPERGFVTVLGDETGLTIASPGLPEAAVLADDRGEGVEIALTLLRSVGWIVRDDLPLRRDQIGPPAAAPEAQCLGEHTFAYAIIPHGPDPLPAWQEAWSFGLPLRGVTTGQHDGPLPPAAALVTVDNPAFVVTAVKAAEDGEGWIVRGCNMSEDTQPVTIQVGLPSSGAEFVRLDETPLGTRPAAHKGGGFRFKAGPAEIVTLRIRGSTRQNR